ncbi:MAG: DEAD/DEAH box helicase family protein, partial [Gemmatimonadaceae bacterium]|nr:DEAD/DEAH box helicase family protein [Gemmatimonadaceae bacterium]
MTPTHDEATAWQWLLRAVGAEPPAATPEVIGRITLLPHQRQAVAALHPLLETRRIALLADDTGLGKTYVACALARRAERPLVVAPAALRNTWRAALDAAGLSAPFLSHEALSRQDAASASPDFVIIDEAHHARTPTTRRWHRLARLCRSARVLLLSATPIHNRPRDFAALIAIGLGPEALHWPVSRLLPLVVRRDHRVLTAVADESAADHRAADHRAADHRAADDPAPALGLTMPSIAPWQWHAVPVDISVAAALAALPPALPASDGTEAAALWRLALLRAWASSTAALVAAVRRRIARGLALAQGLASDQWLSRELLARWTCDDVATPELPLEAASHDPAAAAVHQAADASAGPVA